MAECLLPKQDVAGSNPVSRSNPPRVDAMTTYLWRLFESRPFVTARVYPRLTATLIVLVMALVMAVVRGPGGS